MANADPWAEVGAALAALGEGASSAPVEAAMNIALGSGVPPPPEISESLRQAIAAGLIAADVPARLGFPVSARGAEKTRLRGAAPAAPSPTGAATRLPPSVVRPLGDTPAPPASVEAGERATTSQWSEPDSHATSELSTGMLLGGRYLLERKLGEGGMGVVYFASDQEVKGEAFAVKVLKSEIREQPEALALLREEVRKTRALSHPNVVGVYSLNSDRANVYMLMEYLEGKTLDALIDDDFGRGMPFNRAWPLIEDIGAALAFAHDHSVIHSDLKPSNVFVTTAGRAKLVDFGIARAARGRPRGIDTAALGALTPAYASCEMLEGQEPDSRDDIYALACVIYELLSGKHPFGNRNAVEARDEKLTPAPLAALSRSQNAALAQALSFERQHRTPTVEALVTGLDKSSRSSSRKLVLGAGFAVLGIAAGIAWWTLSGSQRVAVAPAEAPSGPAAQRAHDELTRVRDLAEQTRKLGVDKADPSVSQGLNLLQAGEQQLAAGQIAGADRSLTEAQSALLAAIGGAGRLARIGSEPQEIALAVNLCSKRPNPCSPDDFADEAPRSVVLRPFALDATGVTNAAFAEFVQAKHYTTEAERGRGLIAISGGKFIAKPGESWRTLRDQDAPGAADASLYPVRGIDFDAAQAYCTWRGARLPTEEEWEYSARPDQRIFPWGNDPASPDAHIPARLEPVGEQPPTGRFGERGLGGTLGEWVNGGTAAERVLRGASWLDTDRVNQRLAQRGLEDPTRAHIDTGFRCAKSVSAWPPVAATSATP